MSHPKLWQLSKCCTFKAQHHSVSLQLPCVGELLHNQSGQFICLWGAPSMRWISVEIFMDEMDSFVVLLTAAKTEWMKQLRGQRDQPTSQPLGLTHTLTKHTHTWHGWKPASMYRETGMQKPDPADIRRSLIQRFKTASNAVVPSFERFQPTHTHAHTHTLFELRLKQSKVSVWFVWPELLPAPQAKPQLLFHR